MMNAVLVAILNLQDWQGVTGLDELVENMKEVKVERAAVVSAVNEWARRGKFKLQGDTIQLPGF